MQYSCHYCPLLLMVSISVHFIALSEQFQELAAEQYGVNVRKVDASTVGVSLGEAITEKDVEALLGPFGLRGPRKRSPKVNNARTIYQCEFFSLVFKMNTLLRCALHYWKFP
jgi:hypothetical protein